MGRPSFHYNSVANKWELRGKGGRLIQAFDDGAQGVPNKTMILVGSSIATSIASMSTAVATIAIDGNPLKRGDVVFGNPIIALTASTVGIAGFVVPSDGLLLAYAIGPRGAAGTLAVTGWDIFAMRKTGTS